MKKLILPDRVAIPQYHTDPDLLQDVFYWQLEFSFTLSRRLSPYHMHGIAHTHTHPFNSPFSRTIQVSQYQKGKTNLDFTEARDGEWQWLQLGHMQFCTLLQTDNHASTPPLRWYSIH